MFASSLRVRGVTVVVNDDGRLLAIYRRDSGRLQWTLPFAEAAGGEDLPATLRRSLLEDIGYEIRIEEVAAVMEQRRPAVPTRVLSIFFRAVLISPESTRPQLNRRAIEVGWLDKNSFGEALEPVIGHVLGPRSTGVPYFSIECG